MVDFSFDTNYKHGLGTFLVIHQISKSNIQFDVL